MRILVTGMNSVTTGSERARVRYETVTTILPSILKEAGHEVEWRAVDAGEKLDFDLAFIEAFDLGGMATAGRRIGAMWAALTLPHVLTIGDWQHERIRRSFTPDQFWNTYMMGDKALERRGLLVRRGDEVDRIIASWASKRHPMLMPAFNWGTRDYSSISAGQLLQIDPSRFMREVGDPSRPKCRQWISASLKPRPQLNKLMKGCSWPVVEYCDAGKGKDTRVDEDFLTHDVLSEAWGTLVAPYPTSGNGWWRHRFVYAAQSRCISMSWNECPLPSFQPRWQEVEAMTPEQLRDLAHAQYDELHAASTPREAVVEAVNRFLKDMKP